MSNRPVVLVFFALVLAACSGGLNGSPLALVSPTPGGSAPAGNVTGQVLDLAAYSPSATAGGVGWSVLAGGSPAAGVNPVAGAVVIVGSTLVSGPTAPPVAPSGDVATTTDASGRFGLSTSATGKQYIMVFPAPHDSLHTAVIHRVVTLASGKTSLATQLMAVVTTDEAAWLAQVNLDRAANGAAPVVFDEALLESARYWSNFMGRTGYFAHCIPAASCTPGATATPPPGAGPQDANPGTRDAYFGAITGGWGENIAAGYGTWGGAESAFMAEKANCPGGSAVGCPFGPSTGHFLNIVNQSYVWAGLGEATNGAAPFTTYYDEEFAIPGSGLPSQRERRMPGPIAH